MGWSLLVVISGGLSIYLCKLYWPFANPRGATWQLRTSRFYRACAQILGVCQDWRKLYRTRAAGSELRFDAKSDPLSFYGGPQPPFVVCQAYYIDHRTAGVLVLLMMRIKCQPDASPRVTVNRVWWRLVCMSVCQRYRRGVSVMSGVSNSVVMRMVPPHDAPCLL